MEQHPDTIVINDNLWVKRLTTTSAVLAHYIVDHDRSIAFCIGLAYPDGEFVNFQY